MADELEYNPFYSSLQNEFSQVYTDAQQRGYTICIPESSSLDTLQINSQFVDLHILKPSPFFQGEFLTTGKSACRTLRVEDNFLITGEGFNEERKIEILSTETGYSKDLKSFRLLLIAASLDSSHVQKQETQPQTSAVDQPFLARFSFTENKTLLLSLQDSYKILAHLDENISHFNRNYLLLKDYLIEANERLKTTCKQASEFVQSQCKEPFKDDPRFQENLGRAVESYVLGSVHDKLFPVICQTCRVEDTKLAVKLRRLRSVNAAQLGLHKNLICPLPAAEAQIQSLQELRTPIEKMVAVKDTLTSITEGVTAHVNTSSKDSGCLTSDELIPLLVLVLVRSGVEQLSSQVYHMEHFSWMTSSSDLYSFSLVTLKAAVSYAQTLNVPDESMPASRDAQLQKSSSSAVKVQGGAKPEQDKTRHSSHFDRQLDRITTRLEASSRDFNEANSQSLPVGAAPLRLPTRLPTSIRQTTKQTNLGEFLSSLKEDSSPSLWGKQT